MESRVCSFGTITNFPDLIRKKLCDIFLIANHFIILFVNLTLIRSNQCKGLNVLKYFVLRATD